MKSKSLHKGGHTVSGIFVFLLIGVFAVASILLVLTGINVYRRVTDASVSNSQQLLALSYLGNKVHSYDKLGSVKVDQRNGSSILCLYETIDEEVYETRIFYFDGAMYEQFVLAADEFDPELGERLTEAQAVEFKQLTPNLLQVKVTLPDGSEHLMHVGLRANQAG